MAIDPSTEYVGQVDTDAAYPYGKARNRSAPGSTDGTPLEKLWVNDVFGFFQGILVADGTTPTGTPDSATASQYLEALRRLQSGYQFSALTGSTIAVFTGGQLVIMSGGEESVSGTIELEDGGVLQLKSGSTTNLANGSNVDAYGGSTVTWKTGSQLTQDAGAAASLNGTTTVGATGTVAVASGGHVTLADGGVLTLNGGSNYPVLSSRSEWVPCGGFWFPAYDSQWTNYDGVGPKTAVSIAATSYWRVPVPEHYTITQVQVRWKGPAHPTWPPENRTTFSVYQIDVNGAKNLLATQADTNDQEDYEAVHALTISFTGSPTTFTPGEALLIQMVSESGTNAQEESQWFSPQMYATFTELRTAGG